MFSAIQKPDKSEQERSEIRYKYDSLNRPLEVAINNAGLIRYYYDKKNQMLLTKLFPSGNKSVYSYDEQFRLKSIQNYDPKDNPLGGIQYDWDVDGILKGKKVW